MMVPIVLASDENFAMPLCTAIRSLVDSNRAHWPLDITILTDGFSEAGRRRIEQSLPAGSVRLQWRVIEMSTYADIVIADHLSRMTFARPQMEQWFGPEVGSVIYLDADTPVLSRIATACGSPG